MDEFVGYKMKFRIKEKEIYAVLKNWDSVREEVLICKDDKEERVDICDISDLELCDEQITKEKDDEHNVKENNIREVRNDEKFTEEINITEVRNDEQRSEHNINNNEQIEEINIKEKNEDNTRENNNTKQSEIDLNSYFNLLNECFNFFGPTKEEFCTAASLMIYKIIKSRSTDKNITIQLGNNNLYNCIGYILGRLLLVKDYFVNINEGLIDLEVQKYKFIFSKNQKVHKQNDKKICVNFSDTEILSYDLIFGINSLQPNCINLLLGCVIKECKKSKEGYLVDCNISTELYEKYKLEQIFEKTRIIKI